MMGDAKSAEPRESRPVDAEQPPEPRRVRSADLFQGARQLIIVHNNEEYHLRITRLGKMILSK
jgi:hemin uptake protein HemP